MNSLQSFIVLYTASMFQIFYNIIIPIMRFIVIRFVHYNSILFSKSNNFYIN